jgi:hypothetical protein
MLNHEIRLNIVSIISQINNACASVRCSMDLPEIPDESNIKEIILCANKLQKSIEALKADIDRSRQNGFCDYLSIQHGICMKQCGECPYPDRHDCGGRWSDGHPNHLGKCNHIK